MDLLISHIPKSELYKDPIFKLVGLQIGMFICGIALIVGMHIFLVDKIEALDKSKENEQSRLLLAEHIHINLATIENNVYEIAASHRDKRQSKIFDETNLIISEVREILNLLDKGGVYEKKIAVNLEFKDQLSKRIEYVRSNEFSNYSLEKIDLLPKLAEIEVKLFRLISLARDRDIRRAINMDKAYLSSIVEVDNFLKLFPPLFERMHENTNRIYADSTLHFNQISQGIEEKKSLYHLIENLIAGITIGLVFLLGAIIATRITKLNVDHRLQKEKMIVLKEKAEDTERQNTVIKSIMELSFKSYTLDEMLQKALDAIVTVPWLAVESQGSLFIANPDNRTLKMVAHHKLAPELLTKCAKLDYGVCMCGRAASLEENIFAQHIDERHDITFEGIKPHGHICIPIKSSEKLLGVLNVYLVDGCDRSIINEDFLELVSRTLAAMIDRKNSETMLSKLSHALQQSPSSIVITNLDGIIEYTNPQFSTKTGLTHEEVVGQHSRILKSENLSDEDYSKLWETIKSGKVWRGEFYSKKKDETYFWEAASITPISVTDDKITHYLAVKQDITHQKKIEKDLRKAKRTAEKANRAKSDFLAKMSHEIRTPMNGIIGMSGLLNDTEMTDQQQHYSDTIKASGEALLSIINDILDYSKMEAGKFTLHEDDYDLEELIYGVVELLSVKANEKKIELAYYLSPEVYGVYRGDPGRLRQVLLNLVGNAIKFTDNGGVTIHVTLIEQNKLRFNICDTGIGIKEKDRKKLFESFSQVDTSIARKFGGTGLGLAISKQIIALFNGEIGVDSEHGKGSAFWFEIPFSLIENNQASKFTLDEEFGPVLLIDKCDITARTIIKNLTDYSVQCHYAFTTERALRELEEHEYKVIILNSNMFDESVKDANRFLRENNINSRNRTVLISQDVQKNNHNDDNSFDYTLIKPLNARQLCIAVSGNQLDKCEIQETYKPQSDYFIQTKGNALRILVAEDNKINQQVINALLNKQGHDVVLVGDGRLAIEAVKKEEFDIILMDVQMPVMDGLAATREIRLMDKPLCDIPIVAVTANAMQGDLEKCIEAGMDNYIAKPIKKENLKNLLNDLSLRT